MIPLFILAYLVLASPVLVYPYAIRRQNNPPPPSLPPPAAPIPQAPLPIGGTNPPFAPSSTLINWWPFPPTTTTTPQIPPQPALPTTTMNNVIPDHITLVVPSPSISSESESVSSSTSPSTTTTFTTTSSTSSQTATTTTTTPDDGAQQAHKIKFHKILYFYLIPILSLVGVICLSAVCWLIYGCCTRRPKYRRALASSQSGCDDGGVSRRGEGGWGRYDKEWDSLSDNEDEGGGFKAFRYENFVSNITTTSATDIVDHNDDENENDGHSAYVQDILPCQHSHEFGFECDCNCDRRRQSVVEKELFKDWFKWPSIDRISERFEGIREDDEDKGEEGATGKKKQNDNMRFSFSSSNDKKSPDITVCSRATTAVISPTTTSTSTALPSPTTTRTGAETDTDVGMGKDTIGRQMKLFESVQTQEQLEKKKRELTVVPRVKTRMRGKLRIVKEKSRSGKSMKKGKRSGKCELRDGFEMVIVEEEDEARVQDDENGDDDGNEQSRPFVTSFALDDEWNYDRNDGKGKKEGEKGRGGWLDKMVHSLSRMSSGSSIGSGGKEVEVGDRYTALPGSGSGRGVYSTIYQLQSKSTETETGARTKRLSPQNQPIRPYLPHQRQPHLSYSSATLVTLASNSSLSLDPNTNHKSDMDLSREIARQRERLAKHRESIASLPAGMVYSPPSVGVCTFDNDVSDEEEDGREDEREGDERSQR